MASKIFLICKVFWYSHEHIHLASSSMGGRLLLCKPALRTTSIKHMFYKIDPCSIRGCTNRTLKFCLGEMIRLSFNIYFLKKENVASLDTFR